METKYEGYTIKYDERFDTWEVSDSEGQNLKNFVILSEAKKYIDGREARQSKVKFEKIKILKIKNDYYDETPEIQEGFITSVIDEEYAWVSFDKAREKKYLTSNYDKIILDTPENRKILSKIIDNKSEINKLKKENEALSKTLNHYSPKTKKGVETDER